MGGASSSGSFLANATKRRDQLNKTRGALLDRPGIPPRRDAQPPATAPAMDKSSARQQALEQESNRQNTPDSAGSAKEDARRKKTGAGSRTEAQVNKAILEIDPSTRAEMLKQSTQFISHIRRQKRARLHQNNQGRARLFWGGGL